MSKRRPYIAVLRQLGGIGDLLMMSPLFQALKEQRFPQHDIKLITSSGYADGALMTIAKRIPGVDSIEDIDPYQWSTPQTAIIQAFPAGCKDINEHPVIKNATGFLDLNNICLMHEVTNQESMHRLDIWAKKAGVHIPIPLRTPHFKTTKREKAWAENQFLQTGWHGRSIIGVSLTAMDKARAWPAGFVQSLCQELVAQGHVPVTIDSKYTLPGFSGITQYDLASTMALIEQMTAVIATDTGVLHMAGALDVPLVGVFGPIASEMRMQYYRGAAVESKPMCSPCWYNHTCTHEDNVDRHFICMKQITVTDVMNVLTHVLQTVE